MIKRKSNAYISISIVVIIMTVLIIATYLCLLISQNTLILKNTNSKRQAEYIGEANVLNISEELIENPDYLLELDILNANRPKLKSFNSQLAIGDLDYKGEVNLEVVNYNGKPILKISDKVEYKGVNINSCSNLNIIYDFLYSGIGVINNDRLNESEKLELDDFLNKVDKLFDCGDTKFSHVINTESKLFSNGQSQYLRKGTEIIKLSAMNSDLLVLSELRIGEKEVENHLENVNISGVIVCNSDIVLDTDLDFSGILILRGGNIITNGHICNVKGLIIADEQSSFSNVNTEHDFDSITANIKDYEEFYNPYIISIKLNENIEK